MTKDEDRERRLAQALRENLRKRKAQGRDQENPNAEIKEEPRK